MMSKKEMLSEICQYKLYLLQLLNTFEENQKETKDKELRKYFRKICISIEEQLKVRDVDFARIFESKNNEIEEEKKIPEKLSFILHGDDIAEIPSNEMLMNKINEIIDFLK